MDLTLDQIPSTTGWIAIVQDNFDEIENFVNMIKDPLTKDGEIMVFRETGEVVYKKY